jgi:hypothetical protein
VECRHLAAGSRHTPVRPRRHCPSVAPARASWPKGGRHALFQVRGFVSQHLSPEKKIRARHSKSACARVLDQTIIGRGTEQFGSMHRRLARFVFLQKCRLCAASPSDQRRLIDDRSSSSTHNKLAVATYSTRRPSSFPEIVPNPATPNDGCRQHGTAALLVTARCGANLWSCS